MARARSCATRSDMVFRLTLSFVLVVALLASGAPALLVANPLIGEPQKVFHLNPAAGDEFGYPVVISGDTALIGARMDDTAAGIDAGSVHVFVREFTGAWEYQATLTASDAAAFDYFGMSIAFEGDTAVIGASYADPRGSNSGAAYVFTRSGATWTQRAKLTPSDGAAGDRFGSSAALDGDTIVVGAPHRGNAGAVYVFTGAGATWTQRYTFSSTETGSLYGQAVALSGNRLLVGAPFAANASYSSAGKAYAYSGSGGTWLAAGTLTPAAPGANDYFGYSIAMSGSVVAAGAWGAEDGKGAVTVFTPTVLLGQTTKWNRRALIHGSPEEPGDPEYFGSSIAFDGTRLAVSADGRGRAYLFNMQDPATWTREALLENPTPGQAFGQHVALASDTLIVGASSDSSAASTAGSAYFYGLQPALVLGMHRVAGDDRYLTGVEASKAGFSSAGTVVIATGENWPDALGGSALAGAVGGPLLLAKPGSLPAAVRAEIVRLGATNAYILGGTSAISAETQAAIEDVIGGPAVRLEGDNRYITAELIAAETIRILGPAYSGRMFVATGASFPDATAASPLAAAFGWPILLVNPKSGAVNLPDEADQAFILGGEAVVSAATLKMIDDLLDASRVGGENRYETAAKIAELGIEGGMRWNGVGLATGTNFPDALAGGAMLGAKNSVLLLTPGTTLNSHARGKLEANAAQITTLNIIGGLGAVSQTTFDAAKAAAGMLP